MQVIALILISLVVLEFGVHVIYHALTGKAGLYDAPFAYLKDMYNSLRKGGSNGRH